MRLDLAIALQAGGKGSGPNKPCPECGPKGGRQATKELTRQSSGRPMVTVTAPGVAPKLTRWGAPPARLAPKEPREKIPLTGKPYVPRKEAQSGKGLMKGPKGGPAASPIKEVTDDPNSRKIRTKVQKLADKARKLSSDEMIKYKTKIDDMAKGHTITQRVPDTVGTYKQIKENVSTVPSDKEKANAKLLEEGDKVALTHPVKGFDERNFNSKVFPVGFEATLLKTVPRVGATPAMALIKLGRNGTSEFIKLEDAQLISKAKQPEIDLQPVRRSKVRSDYTAPDGSHVTVLKPNKSRKDDDEDTAGTTRAHSLKGQFKLMVDTSRVPAQQTEHGLFSDPNWRRTQYYAQSQAGKDAGDADRGTSVFVFRHYDRRETIIQEVKASNYGTPEYLYTRRYERPGKATAYLKQRYGIKETLPRGQTIPKDWFSR